MENVTLSKMWQIYSIPGIFQGFQPLQIYTYNEKYLKEHLQ